MNLGTKNKAPRDQLDYDVRYTDWLTPGDGIASAQVTVDAMDALGAPDLHATEIVAASDLVKVWLSGGTSGRTYKVTVLATTDDGRIKDDEFRIKVKDA